MFEDKDSLALGKTKEDREAGSLPLGSLHDVCGLGGRGSGEAEGAHDRGLVQGSLREVS